MPKKMKIDFYYVTTPRGGKRISGVKSGHSSKKSFKLATKAGYKIKKINLKKARSMIYRYGVSMSRFNRTSRGTPIAKILYLKRRKR